LSLEDKYKELPISHFYAPFLRDLGVKAIAFIKFDLMYGPVAYLYELSRAKFTEKIKDVNSLGEIYAGLARTNLDIVESLDEKIVVGRYLIKEKEVESVNILLLICIQNIDTNKLTSLIRSLISRSMGKPEKINEALKFIIESEKKEAHKIIISGRNNYYRGFKIDDRVAITVDTLTNFYGFIFFLYYKSEIDARFLPRIIAGKRIDLTHLIKFVDTQKNEAEIPFNETMSFYYKGLEILIFNYKAKDAVLVAVKKPVSRINYRHINKWFEIFYASYINLQRKIKSEVMLEAINYLDANISKEPRRYTIESFFDLLFNSNLDTPKIKISAKALKAMGNITISRDFELFLENLYLFKGDKTLLEISQNLSVPLSSVIDFVLFLQSRELVEIYRKKARG